MELVVGGHPEFFSDDALSSLPIQQDSFSLSRFMDDVNTVDDDSIGALPNVEPPSPDVVAGSADEEFCVYVMALVKLSSIPHVLFDHSLLVTEIRLTSRPPPESLSQCMLDAGDKNTYIYIYIYIYMNVYEERYVYIYIYNKPKRFRCSNACVRRN